MSNQHTPGPWVIRERTDRLHITPADNEFFMCAAASGFNQAEAQANARLIASAPDLLAALESFVHNYRTSEDMVSAFQMATEAIAKAKG